MALGRMDHVERINRRQCVGGLSAVAVIGLMPQSIAAVTVSAPVPMPDLGKLLAIPAPSDAALFLQDYLSNVRSEVV